MRVSVSAPDIRGELARDRNAIARIHTEAMNDVAVGLKTELREQVEGAGLGTRLANTWRAQTFPRSGASLEPAAYVQSKAAKIIDAYARGATITPVGGRRYLAIPTDNVPLKGRGRKMTPLEVEVAFNQDLIIRTGRGGRKLAFVNVIQARNQRGWRRATSGRLGQGRQTRLVLMFVLTPAVRVAKRLDPDGAVQRWADRFDGQVQIRFDREFGR